MNMVSLLKSGGGELKVVIVTLMVLILLPGIVLVVIATAGVSLLTEALIEVDYQNNLVQLFNADGQPVGEIELSLNWPTKGWVSDDFGSHQDWRKRLGLPPHRGIDIAAGLGQPVTPFLSGQVIWLSNLDIGNCGRGLRLVHEHNLSSLYCHLDQVADLPIGTVVYPGQVIGLMGNSGLSTGSHLHFEIRIYGISINPRLFLKGQPLTSDAG